MTYVKRQRPTLARSACLVLSAFTFQNNALGATPDAQGYVMIGAQRVLTKAQQIAESEKFAKDALPKSLRNDMFLRSLRNRDRVSPPYSAPATGSNEAPITVYEFADLSCSLCSMKMKTVDKILDKEEFEGKIKRVYVHAPADKFTPTNPSAFYSKIAQNSGDFWGFRKDMVTASGRSDTDMVKFLMDQGVSISIIRKNLRENTRQFYKQLDDEASASRVFVRGELPFYMVNGITVGPTLTLENLEDFIRYEIEQVETNPHP